MTEPIPLSALNHYLYCPRRCALIHVEREFVDNAHTTSGVLAHERLDDFGVDHRRGIRIVHAVPVWSDRLGLSGKTDAIEQYPDGSWLPVETKWSRKRKTDNDDVQLCAQGLCLEEMTGRPVPRGVVFHVQSRRRREVTFDAALRQLTEDTARAAHRMIESRQTPEAVRTPRCEGCSMITLCQPDRAAGPSLFGWLQEGR